MLCYRGFRTGSLLMIALTAVGAIAFFATAASAEPIVVFNGTTGSQTLYSYRTTTTTQDPNGEGNTKFVNDTTHDNFEWAFDNYEGGAAAWLQSTNLNQAGTVTWHFQAASGYTMANDLAVKWNVHFIQWGDNPDTTADYLKAEWSTNGTDWSSFVNVTGSQQNWTGLGDTRSLANSGYSGGTDLYVRFTMYRVGEAQLFRGYKDDPAPFSISGTVSAIPEPTTAILLGSGVLGLMAYAWRKRK